MLVDGHNRYEICTKNGIAFATVTKEFEGREDAIEWIINNQFGRRNLTDYQRGVLALRLKPIIEARARVNQQCGQGGVLLPQNSSEANSSSIETREAVASLAGVSHNTVSKVEKILDSESPEVIQATRAGDVSIHLASQFVDLPPEAQQEALEVIAQQETTAKNGLCRL